jgi:translation initiation factor 1
MSPRGDDGTLVYSSEHGSICPTCQKSLKKCRCSQPQAAPKGDGIVRVGRETKGRKGKGVTMITGVLLPEKELKVLAKELKKKSGTGGTLKNGVIEIQGDQRDLMVQLLEKKGFKVKRSGG